MRGNPGGAIDTLKYLLGGIFGNDVKIADRKGRKELKPEIAKSRGHNFSEGKIIVLVDSQSASASELFARIVQLEKCGTVIGDRSSGSVVEAMRYDYHLGADTRVFYGASITESDLIMTDGKSLEHTGVTPDEVVLPSAADLASGRDPVLAHAAALLGAKLTPEDAGKMFPYEWPKEWLTRSQCDIIPNYEATSFFAGTIVTEFTLTSSSCLVPLQPSLLSSFQ